MAQDLNVDPLSNLSISKDDIFKSLDNLKKEGKISDADYEKAKLELKAMSDTQVNGMKDTAVNMIRKDPDKAVDLIKGSAIDMKEVEKQAGEAAVVK